MADNAPLIELSHRSYLKSHYLTCRIGGGGPVRAVDLWGQALPPVTRCLESVPATARMLPRHRRYFWIVLLLAVTGTSAAMFAGMALVFIADRDRTPAPGDVMLASAGLLTGLLFVGLGFLLAFDSFRYFLLMVDTYNATAKKS